MSRSAGPRPRGPQLTGEGGLLQHLTKRLHLGYDRHDAVGKDGGNSRNGKRSKTVLTDVGPVETTVPRDRDCSLAPKIVKKRQKRLTGIDEMVISLAVKGLTTGEVQAHLTEVSVSQPHRRAVDFAHLGKRPVSLPASPRDTTWGRVCH